MALEVFDLPVDTSSKVKFIPLLLDYFVKLSVRLNTAVKEELFPAQFDPLKL